VYVETFSRAKDPARPELNEDRAVVYGGRTFAVIDGVTDKSGLSHGGLTGGVLAGRALEAALRELTDEGALASAPAVEVAARLTAAVAAEHERWGVAEEAARDPTRRFAAAVVLAHVADGAVRVIGIGDCGARVNGRVVVQGRNRADAVLSALRAAAFAALAEVEPAATLERRLELARAYTVHGVGDVPPGEDLGAGTHAAVAARAREAALAAAAGWPADLAEEVVRGGLRAVAALRRVGADGASALGRAGLDFGVVDGSPIADRHVQEHRRRLDGLDALELFSDGYFGCPERHGRVALWEAHFSEVERVDPHRVGAFASTKGSYGGRYADDRTVVIVRRDPPAA